MCVFEAGGRDIAVSGGREGAVCGVTETGCGNSACGTFCEVDVNTADILLKDRFGTFIRDPNYTIFQSELQPTNNPSRLFPSVPHQRLEAAVVGFFRVFAEKARGEFAVFYVVRHTSAAFAAFRA